MRFHSRVVKASFWHDPDLCDNLPFLGRIMYQGLWAIADDSFCIIDSPAMFKRELFGDEDSVTVAKTTEWRDTLVRIGKLVPYEVAGKRCLWIKNMHNHQRVDKPSQPRAGDVPLPPWIEWKKGNSRSTSDYVIITDRLPDGVADMSPTSSGQVADVERTCRCIEPRTQNLEPVSEEEPAREDGPTPASEIIAGWKMGTEESGKNLTSGCQVIDLLLERAEEGWSLDLLRELARESAGKAVPRNWLTKSVLPNLDHSNVRTLADYAEHRRQLNPRTRAAPTQQGPSYPKFTDKYPDMLGGGDDVPTG
jgi:hypothetical protein